MKALVERVMKRNKNNNYKIKTAVLADGAYDNNKNFKYLQKKRILPAIKVRRKNSTISTKNNKMRNREKLNCKQKRSPQMEKEKKIWTQRWIAKETVFSSIKRMFGEYVSATRFQNRVKEMMIKVSLYNLFRRLA